MNKRFVRNFILNYSIVFLLLVSIILSWSSGNTVKAAEEEDKTYVVCIDPGHFGSENKVKGKNSYGYSEGEFSLKIARELKKELEGYGIKVKMTRKGRNISISGYKNKVLDDYTHLYLRGEYSKGCDLFVSLHTNSNGENANKHKTFNQNVSLNKTLVIVNKNVRQNKNYMNMANEIGKAVTKESYNAGILERNIFVTRTKKNLIKWTGNYNDSEGVPGTVCYRLNSRGEDGYGVLRGAANVGVPGMIIEHGYHSVKEVRYAAMRTDLASKWAKADAYGIAKGFGLVE